MANETTKNLIPQSERTKDEQREIARMGGVASGKARREKKTIRKILSDLLDGQIKDNPQFVKLASKMGIDSDKSVKDIFTMVCLLNSVKEGNLADLERLAKLLGEDTKISSETDNNMQALADLINRPQPNRSIEDFEGANDE
jgi:hypothetical protein